MRVVLYTQPYFLDEVLSAAPALAAACELHVIVEIPPEGWLSNMLPERPADTSAGLHDLRVLLRDEFPGELVESLAPVAGLYGAVFNERRTLTPAAVASSLRLGRFMRSLRPDVVHVNGGGTLRFAYGLPMLGNTPVILSLHDPMPHSGEMSWKKRLGLARRATVPKLSSLVVHNHVPQSGPWLESVRARGVPEWQVLMGPYTAYRSFRTDSNADAATDPEPTVLFLGRISPYKGLDTFVDAASLASRSLTKVRFVVAGRPAPGLNPPASSSLQNGCRVDVIARHLSSKDVAALVSGARFLVLPYRDATQSGVVLTAFGLGKTVVATNVGGLGDYVEHDVSGLLVPPRDPHALADSVVELCTSDEHLRSLEAGVAATLMGEVSWETFARKLCEIYRQAAVRHRSEETWS